MLIRKNVSRRQFLGGATAAAALTPFVPMLESHAGGSGAPTRLIILYSGAGSIMPRWRPTGNETDWELSELLSPLAPHKDDIIVLDGVDNEAAHHHPVEPGQGGHHSIASLWSGAPVISEADDVLWSSSVTLDQHIAQRIGDQTLFPSLEFGVDVRSEVYWKTRLSYTGPAQPVEPIGDPQVMLQRIFGDPSLTESDLLRLRQGRLSVIDSVSHSLAALNGKSSKSDQVKIDQHLTSLREIEQQVSAGLAACDAPTLETLSPPQAQFGNYPKQTEQMLDLMVSALACDATRVATFMWSHENSNVRFPWLDLGIDDTRLHGLSHLEDSDHFALEMQWYAEQVNGLLDRLAARPEGDGTMLDNTVVVWASPVSVSWRHISRNLPIVLAGRGGGYFETGRYHRYGDYDFASRSHDPHGGRAMNDLHLSILHAMGLTDEETFGSPEFCTGPLL